MDLGKQFGSSHLFLLRTWAEDRCDEEHVWWARVQHIFTGEARTFRVGPELAEVLLELLADAYPRQQADKAAED
jgi:hypothetical protein